MQEQQQRPPPSLVEFARGVIARLAVWPVLRVAVQENWGGPKTEHKRTWLASEIVDAFEKQVPSPDDQYVEEMLLQVMEDEFECVVGDGSAESVGKDIVKMWEESQMGRQDMVLKFEELAEKAKGQRVAVDITSEENGVDGEEEEDWEDESDEEMETDETPKLIDHGPGRESEPEVDEDGFTLVKRKGRGNR